MVVLIDTNIVLDVLQKRDSFFDVSLEVLTKCASGEIKGYMAVHTVCKMNAQRQ